jgi:hypothetical protein
VSDQPTSPTPTPSPTPGAVPFYKRQGVQTAVLIVVTLLIAFQMARMEVVRRAKAAYQRGEKLYEQRSYREALWNYQEVQEFYYVPKSKWVDMAAKREWECRAYLVDWIPPEGPMDADVRQLRPDYPMYKDLVAQITPVGDTTFQPAPLTAAEQGVLKGPKAKKPPK